MFCFEAEGGIGELGLSLGLGSGYKRHHRHRRRPRARPPHRRAKGRSRGPRRGDYRVTQNAHARFEGEGLNDAVARPRRLCHLRRRRAGGDAPPDLALLHI